MGPFSELYQKCFLWFPISGKVLIIFIILGSLFVHGYKALILYLISSSSLIFSFLIIAVSLLILPRTLILFTWLLDQFCHHGYWSFRDAGRTATFKYFVSERHYECWLWRLQLQTVLICNYAIVFIVVCRGIYSLVSHVLA